MLSAAVVIGALRVNLAFLCKCHLVRIYDATDSKWNRALVAQWVKCWPADLVVPDSRLAVGANLSNVKKGCSLCTSFHHHPSIVLI